MGHPRLKSIPTAVAPRRERRQEAARSRPLWARLESVLVSRELLWLVVLFGIVVRLWLYAANRSLWLDESFLALNIIGRNMDRLLTDPLDFNQTAPVGFLFVEKLATEIFDKGEYGLRALPLLGGIVALLLYPYLARRVAGPVAAVIAVAFFAFSGPMIYYSSELKPYAGDVAATIAISLMAIAALDDRLTIRRALAFGGLGFVLIQLTYAGILACAGTVTALIVIFAVDRCWDRFVPVLVLAAIWAVGGATFLLTRPGVERSQFSQGEFGRFAPVPASVDAIRWYFRRAMETFADANLHHESGTPLVVVSLLAGGLAVLGLANFALRRWRVLVVLAAPVLATFAASGAQRYPLLARTMLFFVPLLFLLVANGVVVLARRLPFAIGTTAAVGIVGALLVNVSFAANYNVTRLPNRVANFKASLSYVADRWRPGDVLYIHYASQYTFAYYSECRCFRVAGNREPGSRWPVRRLIVRDPSDQWPPAVMQSSSSVIIGTRRPVSERGRLPNYGRDAAQIARHPRAWILVSFHLGRRELHLIEQELLRPLDRRGRRVRSRSAGGTLLYLYRFPVR